MAVDWQRFVMVPGRTHREHIMIVGQGSSYGITRPPTVVLQVRPEGIFQVAPETRIPTVWETDSRGLWHPVERGHSRTRAIAERHPQRSVRSDDDREPGSTRREKGIFGRRKARNHRRGNAFFPAA